MLRSPSVISPSVPILHNPLPSHLLPRSPEASVRPRRLEALGRAHVAAGHLDPVAVGDEVRRGGYLERLGVQRDGAELVVRELSGGIRACM